MLTQKVGSKFAHKPRRHSRPLKLLIMKHQFTKFAIAFSALCMLSASAIAAQTADYGFSHRGREAAAPNPQVRKATPRQQAEMQTLVWGWCGEADMNMMGSGPDKDMWILPMVGLTPNLATKYAGAKIKSVLVARGDYREANPVMNIVVAHGEQSLSEWGTPKLTLTETLATLENQDISAGNPGDWMEFELPEPIEIKAGVPIYVGYEYKVLSVEEDQLSLCAVSDGILNSEPNSSWMDVKSPNPDTGELESWGFWSNSETVGSNCIRLRLEGDHFPAEDAVIIGFDVPRHVEPGKAVAATLTLSNAASAEINSVDLKYGFIGEEQKSTTVSGIAIAPGGKGEVKLSGLTSGKQGNRRLAVEVTAVNSKADADPSNNIAEASLLCLDSSKAYKRNVLVEEGTGTWCGNCPRGVVALKRMNEKYPDNFIGVAVHSDDEMTIDEYYPFLDRYINTVGYPYCTVDRAIACDPGFDELEPNFLKEADIPALVKLNVDKYEIDGSTLKFDAGAEFALSEADVSYAWAFVVTEDNVGPLPQQNYYTDGSLEGWDYTTNPVLMKFNEVAVGAESVMGDEKALITSTTAGQTVKVSGTISGDKVADWNNTHLVLMMLDTRNGQVQNSYKCKLWTAGVDSVAADKARVEVLDGVVTLLSGDSARIYTVAGAKVAELTAGASARLPQGLYIVECDGQARKVLVR